MSIERKPGGRGRPRDPAKLEAILDAAYDLFLDRGIAATPMDLVAERAGVSKMTVYANFQDKPALLAAVFDRRIKTMRLPHGWVEPESLAGAAHRIRRTARVAPHAPRGH